MQDGWQVQWFGPWQKPQECNDATSQVAEVTKSQYWSSSDCSSDLEVLHLCLCGTRHELAGQAAQLTAVQVAGAVSVKV